VANLFTTRLPATLTVMVPILVLEVMLAIPFALAVAYVRGSLTDRGDDHDDGGGVDLAAGLRDRVPVLLRLPPRLVPGAGLDRQLWTNLTTYAPLPIFVAVAVALAPYTRLYRSFFLDEIGHDYVRTARAKGMTENTILFKHVLRNAMIPILTNVAVALPGVFVGSFLIEVFFSIPGLGREILLAVNRSDYPVIQAFAIYIAFLTMVINLATDLLYKLVDPRVVLK
jgi:peptide/nickel transport system permease protein